MMLESISMVEDEQELNKAKGAEKSETKSKQFEKHDSELLCVGRQTNCF